jgi:adenylosuccinate synthase
MAGKSTVLIGTQYGDEGKGRILDTLLGDGQYQICARHNGGANAGHTIHVGDKKIALHQVPSGVFYPNVMLYIGSGCVLNPVKLVNEIETIENLGISLEDRLLISGNVNLIQPHHILFDKLYCQKPLGTTANGIGPAYADLAVRMVQEGETKRLKSVRFGDYLAQPQKYSDVLRQNLISQLHSAGMDESKVESTLSEFDTAMKKLELRWSKDPLMLEKLVEQGNNVFFEGAQSVMLDVLYGTYPCVTSSRCVAAAAYTGGDLSLRHHSETIGVVKAIMSRVGVGPFISELGGRAAEEYWMQHQNDAGFNEFEKSHYNTEKMLSSSDLAEVNIALRILSQEYGASTKRPRRVGMLDLVMLNQVCKMNGVDKLYINKIDDLGLYSKTKLSGVPLVVAYELHGQRIDYLPTSIEEFGLAKPVVEYLPHIPDLSQCRDIAQLPGQVTGLIKYIEDRVGVPVYGIGVGPERNQFIKLKE